jgi:DNA primase
MSAPTEAQARQSIERRGVSRSRVIEEAKEKVHTVDLAERLCGPGGLRKAGKERVGRCPLPDHEDKTPSFTVNPEKNLWFCHGVSEGRRCRRAC